MSVDEIKNITASANTERVGDRLRSAREARELSVADVSEELLIKQDYLNAIEAMYAGGIPNGYVNGILRTYAGYLGLSGDEIVEQFSEQCGAISQAPKREAVVQSNLRLRSTLQASLAGFAAAVALIAAGGAGWILVKTGPSAELELATAPVGTPVNGARESLFAASVLDTASTQLPLTLTAVEQGWLEVRGADGTIFRSRTMSAGEIYHPRIGAGWTVSAQNGAAFKWHVGDVEIGALGEAAAPVYAISVDTVASEAQAIASPALAAVSENKPSR